MRSLGLSVFLLLPSLATAVPKEQAPPLSRLVVAEAVKALESAAVGADLRVKLASKRKQLEAELKAEQQKLGLVAAPNTPEEQGKAAEFKAKAEAAQKQMEDYLVASLPEGLAALRQAIQPKLTRSKVDYMLDAAALIRYPRHLTTAAQIEPQEVFFSELISECRLVRVSLAEITAKTSLGKKLYAELAAAKAKLEKAHAAGQTTVARAELAWKDAVATYNRTLHESLVAAYRSTRPLEGAVCLLHTELTADARAVVLEPQRAPVAKIPDSTPWFIANLDTVTDKLAAAEAAAQSLRKQRSASVAAWVARLGKLEALRGAALAPPPSGWKEAWRSTEAFEAGVETLVGIDRERLPRIQVVFGKDLAVEAAIALAKEVDGAIDDWADDYWSADNAVAPDLPKGIASAGVWEAVDDKQQRVNGTLLLLSEQQANKKYRVVLQFADARLAWPLK